MRWVCVDQDVARQVAIPWAQSHIALDSPFGDRAKAIMLFDDLTIVAATIYTDFTDRNLCMHIASDGTRRWMTRAFLFASFSYPFEQLGVARVTGLVAASNPAALRFDLHLGFRIEGRLRTASPDGSDLLVLGMLRQECRHLRAEHGKQGRKRAAVA